MFKAWFKKYFITNDPALRTARKSNFSQLCRVSCSLITFNFEESCYQADKKNVAKTKRLLLSAIEKSEDKVEIDQSFKLKVSLEVCHALLEIKKQFLSNGRFYCKAQILPSKLFKSFLEMTL